MRGERRDDISTSTPAMKCVFLFLFWEKKRHLILTISHLGGHRCEWMTAAADEGGLRVVSASSSFFLLMRSLRPSASRRACWMRACIASGETSFGRCESMFGVAEPQEGGGERDEGARRARPMDRTADVKRATTGAFWIRKKGQDETDRPAGDSAAGTKRDTGRTADEVLCC